MFICDLFSFQRVFLPLAAWMPILRRDLSFVIFLQIAAQVHVCESIWIRLRQAISTGYAWVRKASVQGSLPLLQAVFSAPRLALSTPFRP